MKNNVKVGVILTYITQFMSIGISFVYVPIMLRILGQGEYGLYALVQSIIAYIQMTEFGIGTTAVRFNSKYIANKDIKGQRRTNGMIFLLYLGITLISLIIGSIVYCNLNNIYGSNLSATDIIIVKNLFILALFNLTITFVFQIFNAIIISYEKFFFLKLLMLIQTILGPIGMLIVLHFGYRAIGMLVVTTVISSSSGLIQMIYSITILKVKFDFRNFDKVIFKGLFSFTFFVFLNSFAHQLFSNADKIIISIFKDASSIAIYAIAIQLSGYFYTFSNVITGLYMPRITKIVIENPNDDTFVIEELIKIGRLQSTIGGLIFGGLIALGHSFILRWVGTEYNQVYIIMMIIIAPQVIGASQSLFTPLMQAMNLHKKRACISIVTAIIKVIFTVVFIQIWGLLGCAIAYCMGYIIRLVGYNFYYLRIVKLNMKKFWNGIVNLLVPISIIIVLLSISFSFFTFNNYMDIIVGSIVYTIIYIVFLLIFGFNNYEKKLILSQLIKIYKKILMLGGKLCK